MSIVFVGGPQSSVEYASASPCRCVIVAVTTDVIVVAVVVVVVLVFMVFVVAMVGRGRHALGNLSPLNSSPCLAHVFFPTSYSSLSGVLAQHPFLHHPLPRSFEPLSFLFGLGGPHPVPRPSSQQF
jgi:hypothetical protein